MSKKVHLIVYTRGGHEFHVRGENVEDVPRTAIMREGWSNFILLNGKSIQIYSGEIVAIGEATE